MRQFLTEIAVTSTAYVVASLLVFELLMPLQTLAVPHYVGTGSLLFLPHGVRVLAAWLLGWRAIPALLPGVIFVFAWQAGAGFLTPSRGAAILFAVSVAPITFHVLKAIGYDLFPSPSRMPCWPCILGVGALTSVLISTLTNTVFGSGMTDYMAYFIGDVAGLFFLMLGLLYFFRMTYGRA
ncbi:hypothetical protein ACFORG_08850 [Lutimaribacter marinistellae]|uniref:MASE1 domain-containing protein n=1 Tax=Lutimaribacter marinistellae TaxID=1820329 RepID=A0ABV7TG66_9RHOB